MSQHTSSSKNRVGKKHTKKHKKMVIPESVSVLVPETINVNEEDIRAVVKDAFFFLNTGFTHYIPVMVNGDQQNLKKVIRKISQRMRCKMSIPTTYAALQMLMRLNEYAAEAEDAYHEDRVPIFPRPCGNTDYTLKCIWVIWNRAIEDEANQQKSWQELDWNPYAAMVEGLDKLISHIWHKHFDVKNL